MVFFDYAKSFAVKIMENGLRGLAMWEAEGNFHNILLDSIKSAAGLDTIYMPTLYSTLTTFLSTGSISDLVIPSKPIV
jgi:hypothetical protein